MSGMFGLLSCNLVSLIILMVTGGNKLLQLNVILKFFPVDIFVFKDTFNPLKVGIWQCAKKICVISPNPFVGKVVV